MLDIIRDRIVQIQGTHLIAAPRARVWALLNDPDALAQCAPGVTELRRDGDDHFAAIFTVALGPMKSNFRATIALTDKTPLEAMTIEMNAQSPIGALGAAGRITLADEGDGTRVTWSGEPRLMGMLASVGGRFAQSAAKANAETFFTKLEQLARTP
jgi:carbon monoxide dehydrogenase subunit G